jgi:hypothetical protein
MTVAYHIHACGGTPTSARIKAHNLTASRTFFRDCQEWEWIERRISPARPRCHAVSRH